MNPDISLSLGHGRSVNVLWVAESNFIMHTGIKTHDHDYYHLFMVRQGPLEFTVGDEECELQDGEFVLAKPGVPHGLRNEKVHFTRCYEVKFTATGPRLEKLLKCLPSRMPADELAGSMMRELVEEGARNESSTPYFVSDYMQALITYFSRHYGSHDPSDTYTIDTSGYSETSQQIVQYLEAHYEREIPLQEVADVVGFNKNYICSSFKRDSGMTIGNCLTLIRIRKAAELISFSDMNLQQVAQATGFTNTSHFNRIFKKVVGIPPGQYRRMFTADILVSEDIDQEKIMDIVEQNGFIVSVLGRKHLSIVDILERLRDGDESETSLS